MNKVILVGNICREIEIDTVGKGKNKVARVWNTLAINNGKDKEATFIPFTLLGKNAEIVAEYCAKGDKLLIEGYIDSYFNEKGERDLLAILKEERRNVLSITGSRIELLGSKGK